MKTQEREQKAKIQASAIPIRASKERHFCLLWRDESERGGRLARNILRREDCRVQWDGLHLTPGSQLQWTLSRVLGLAPSAPFG